MASVTWSSTKGGNWGKAANWTNTTTGKQQVPGSGDDATIDTTGAIAVSIASGSYLVASLYTGSTDTLKLTGGSLGINNLGIYTYNYLYGEVLEASANSTLTLSGLTTIVYGAFQQLVGTVVVQSGELQLMGGGNTLEGTVAGAGWLELGGSATTELLGATLTIAHWAQLSGTIQFVPSSGPSVSYAGQFYQYDGQLNFESDSAIFSGRVTLAGDVGNGALTLDGTATLDGTGFNQGIAVTIGGATTVRGASVSLGDATQGASMEVLASATLRFADTSGIGVTADVPTASVITVDSGGTLLKSGAFGESSIQANLTLTAGSSTTPAGTIAIAAGCALGLDGTLSEVGGLVTGAGTLALDGYQSDVTFGAQATLDVGTVLLAGGYANPLGSVTYAGTWLMTGGDLTQTAGSLTLTGTAFFEGGAVFAHTITATSAVLGGSFSLYGSTDLQLSGSSVQTSLIQLGVGTLDNPTLDVLAGATYTIDDGTSIYGNTTMSVLLVAGTLVAEGPATAEIWGSADITGALVVSSGTLDFAGEDLYGYGTTVNLGGKIRGAGTLELGGGTTLAAGSALSVAALEVNGSLALLGSESYAGVLSLGANATVTVPAHLVKTKIGTVLVQDTLTLGGAAWLQGTVNGGGVLASTGPLSLASGMVLDGTATLSVAGVAEQYGNIWAGYSSGASSVLDIQSGATWTDDGFGISTAAPGANGTVVNAGTFSFANDAPFALNGIYESLDNTGLVQVLSGDMVLGGTVTGNGSFEIASGATLGVYFPTFDATGAIGFAGAFGELTASGTGTLSFAVSGFASSDEIDLASFNFATTKPLALSGGVLTVSDGTNTAEITVGSAAKLSNFEQQSDILGGIAIFHT